MDAAALSRLYLALRRGSDNYLGMALHAAPQTLGLGYASGLASPPAISATGGAATTLGLDYVGSMEVLETEYQTIESRLLEGSRPHSSSSPPQPGRSRAKVGARSGIRRKQKGITRDQLLASIGPATQRALCLLMRREYACLSGLTMSYTMPPQLAQAC